MSYTLVPYMIDLAKLRATIGSKDAGLIKSIAKKDPKIFAADNYEPVTVGQACEHLVMGGKLVKKAGHQYGYALAKLAEHVGKRLSIDMWSGVGWAAMEDSGVARIMESGPPVKLPKINDFPVIGFLDSGRVTDMVEKMGDEGLTNENDELEELLKEFEAWLRKTAKAKKDLLLFYY